MKCISDLCTSTYNFILKLEIIQYIINLIKNHTPQKEQEIHKKDEEYKLFTNTVFNKENEAEEFGKKSMKRNYEHKVLEYNKENYDRYWNEKDT